MRNKSFDDIIRSKLSGFRSSKQADWHSFEQMMAKKNAELSDKSFDNQLARKLNAFGTTVPEGSWESFSERHKLVRHLQSNLKSLKLVEACIVLLMLFIFSGPFIYFNSQTKADNIAIDIDHPHDDNTSILKPSTAELDKSLMLKQKSNFNLENEDSSNPPLGDKQKNLEQKAQLIDDTANTIVGIPSDDEPKDFALSQELSDGMFSENNKEVLSSEFRELISLRAIEKLKTNSFRIREEVEVLDIPMAPIRIYIDQRLDADYISFYSAFDNNFIHTPDDLEYNTEARKTEMFGYSLGLMYSRKRGAFEWLTGLMYSSLDKPWDFTLQYGNQNGWFSFIMTNLHFKMAGLPMELNYHLVENHEWSLLARLGITHSFIMSSQYQTANSFLGGGSYVPGDEIPDPEDGFSPFENERAFTKGLLQGGGLRDNYFMRSYIGAGIQRNISPEVAINFSAAYHRNIINTTIGPNNDRFDKFEISFGLKLRLQ